MSEPEPLALVTGASSGLGAELALSLARCGCHVVAVGRDHARLSAVAERADGRVEPVTVADLGTGEDADALIRDVSSRGPIEYLVYAAGSPAFSSVADIDDAMLDYALAGNLRGLIHLSTRVVGPMKRRGSGAIVGILSTAALTGRADEGAYAAAKWGARGYLECLRAACKGSGVRVISVFPGGMNTPFWSKQSHLSPKLETYMNAATVAEQIVSTVLTEDAIGYTSTLTIERK